MGNCKVHTHKLIHRTTVKETFECSYMVAEAQAFGWNQKLQEQKGPVLSSLPAPEKN